jgi:hypothetical protein
MLNRARFCSTAIDKLKKLPSNYAQQTVLRSIEHTRTPPATGSRLIFKTSYNDLADFRAAVLEAKKSPICETSQLVLDTLAITNESNVNLAKAVIIVKHNDPLILFENKGASSTSNTIIISLPSFCAEAEATNNLAKIQVMCRPHIPWRLISCGVVTAIIVGFPYLI